MGVGNTFTLVAAAMICKLLNEKVVMGLPQSILWGHTIKGWVNLAQNDYPRVIGEPWEYYPVQRLNSVALCHFRDPYNTTSWVSSACFSPCSNYGGHNAR